MTASLASGSRSFPELRPSQAPRPINRSHRPSTTPSAISLPASVPSSSRISASCVITHDTPSAPTAARTSPCRSGTVVLFFKALDVVDGDRDILAPPGGGFTAGLLREMLQELDLVRNLRPDLRQEGRRARADIQ